MVRDGLQQAHGLKLVPKKCHFLRWSVTFLGHVVDGSGVAADPDKVKFIYDVEEADLMTDDSVTLSKKFDNSLAF